MKKLRAWIDSSNSLCLDLRTKLDFKTCHLKSSTNIPLSQLVLRQSELPPKRLPFAVIEPLDDKGCSSWLIEQGWQVPWVFWEGEMVWKQVLANQWAAETDEQCLLFQPSPFLMNNIELIEQNLPKDTKWTCLDIGCGSGRDVGWMLARGNQWRASAFDSLAGAMVRTDILVRNLNVAPQLDILAQAKLMNSGQWKLISNAWWNEHHNQDTKELQDSLDEIARRLAMVELENSNKEILYSFSDFYKHLLPKSTSNTFDLILNIRFLSRPFLLQVPDLLNVGGYFIISHFVDDERYDYKQPKKSLRLELNEISNLYGKMSNMEIVKDVIEEIEDGRPINSIIVRKIK